MTSTATAENIRITTNRDEDIRMERITVYTTSLNSDDEVQVGWIVRTFGDRKWTLVYCGGNSTGETLCNTTKRDGMDWLITAADRII
jgi:hypothetical protein